MFSCNITKILGRSQCGRALSCRFFSSTTPQASTGVERDPAPLFFNQEVQGALKFLTRIDYKKAVRKRLTGKRIEPPRYKFMTDKQLQQALNEAKQRARKRLQMPPVLKVREEIMEVLSHDDALEGLNDCKFVFTDISFGIKNKDRYIVVREPSGTLRKAKWEERDRINFVYYPTEGKEMVPPALFQGEYFQDILNRECYEYILDRACVQFEPDDIEYKNITQQVYQRVNDKKHFESLRSTRHFGPFVFFLVWHKIIDNLLCELIQTEKIEEAVTLIRLFHKIHPDTKSATTPYKGNESDDDIALILHYASLESSKEPLIKKSVLAYLELKKEKEKVEEGIKKAHGIDSDESELPTK